MKREKKLKDIENKDKQWDLVVIGGGSSGLGVALDALSRGLSVVLLEKADFAKGTSSRSTKLLHGGVRYLAQGDIGLVIEALKERGLLMKNAPHVSRKQAFVIPIYSRWDQLKYGVGLRIYDLMAGNFRIGKSKWLTKKETIEKLPNIKKESLKGGVNYYDGQFDDARLALNIAQTCTDLGGIILNYMKVNSLTKDANGVINGVMVQDQIHQNRYTINAKAVVNATGVFTDKILKMDNPEAKKSITPSQGSHLVLDLSFLGGNDALMIPQTSDGRVLFGIPWNGKLVLGTTDTIRKSPKMEPTALESEIDFILETCAQYLVKPPKRSDVLSVYAGLRPLAAAEEGAKTKEISRSHKVIVSESHLFSIIGGKWTTFRKMGEDTVDMIASVKGFKIKNSNSEKIELHGFKHTASEDCHLSVYGTDGDAIKDLIAKRPDLSERLHPNFPNIKAEVLWMVRNEMALKVEDVLARRIRILFLDAQAALEMAPVVAKIMGEELGWEEDRLKLELKEFKETANKYMIN